MARILATTWCWSPPLGIDGNGDKHPLGLVEGLRANDWFMVLNDFESYRQAQRRIDAFWADQPNWWRKSIANTAHCGWFSADRSIREYAQRIWHVEAGFAAKG